ncbi:terminus macrodomain insulation protein YfbV [Salinimonas chungwhensis]|uniref:terminus macrodomain insulation protein YfbV n=1 Tax=Salinimonas chungwhensis TaxID=265425 RepID=UPI00037C595F|nr:terminus macrodomain insulation protein YfbV [Salinimonas chungwhensis]
MSQSVMTLFRDGQHYMSTWPVKKELFPHFAECRVISATRFAIAVMPPVAVVCSAMLINSQGTEYLPQTLAMGAFFLSLPLQGLLWLGHRSNQALPPALKSWYYEIHGKLQQEGCDVHSRQSEPKYRELAALLKSAFDQLDKVFTRRWFE